MREDGRQRAVPVVRVDDVGAPVLGDREARAGQQREPVAVVVGAVDLRPVEQLGALDQVDLDRVQLAAEHVRSGAARAGR